MFELYNYQTFLASLQILVNILF